MLLSPAKTLTEPLFILLVAAVAACVVALRREGSHRRAVAAALGFVGLLWLLSIAVVSDLLQATLARPAQPLPHDIEVIVVLSGGWRPGIDRAHDHLNVASLERTIGGVELAKRFPNARLILSGANRTRRGRSLKPLELMRDEAIRRGIPPERIELEAMSVNTRQHPRFVRLLPAIRRDTKIAIVTSDWHVARAEREFRRHFTDVHAHGAKWGGSRFILNDVIPSATDLVRSTVCIQEWIGIAWYALLDALPDRDSGDAVAVGVRR